MTKHNSKPTTAFLKCATAVVGIACGLLTTWLTLVLLSSSDNPIFVRRDVTSATVQEAARVKLTVYYPLHLGTAPNPPSKSLTQDDLFPNDARRPEALIHRLATYLGPDVIIRPIAAVSNLREAARGSHPLNPKDMTTAGPGVAQQDSAFPFAEMPSRWPPARHVPLTIGCESDGADHGQSVPEGYCGASSWQIVFPKGTETNQAIARVLMALSSLEQESPLVVANYLKELAELDGQLRQLSEQYSKTWESLLGPWREKQSEMCDLALTAVQHPVTRQPCEYDPLLTELQATRANLLRRRQQLLMTHTAEHPETKQVESLLAEVEKEIQLRSRRTKEYPVSREHEDSPVPRHETTWLSLQHANSIGSPPSSLAHVTADREGESSAQRDINNDSLQRFLALRSALQSYDQALQEGLNTFQADMGRLQERFMALRNQFQQAIANCELRNAYVIEPDPKRLPPSNEITRQPTLWSLLLALVTGVFAHGAVASLITGFAERQYITSAGQLSAMTNGPVFQMSLPGKTRIIEEGNPISPPHFSMTTTEISNKSNQKA